MSKERVNELFRKIQDGNYNSPEELDQLGKEMIEVFIRSLPEEKQKRFQGKQFVIDQELAKYPTPLGRLQRFQEIFFNEVYFSEYGFVSTMQKIGGYKKGDLQKPKNERPANIVSLKPKEK